MKSLNQITAQLLQVSARGFVFHTKSEKRLSLPTGVEMVWAKKIWVP